jgi:hypothetical protein
VEQGEGRDKTQLNLGGKKDAQRTAKDSTKDKNKFDASNGAQGNNVRHEAAGSTVVGGAKEPEGGAKKSEQQTLGDWKFRWDAVST